MVRTAAVLFLPSVLATESVLMQSQASSEGALALESANEHMMVALHSGSSRVQKMQQSTKAMEDQYRSLLENIVKSQSMTDPATGTPWLPSTEFFNTVGQQFTALKDELKQEKADNEKILQEAHDEVKSCNTKRRDAFSNATHGVLEMQSKMQGARDTHKDCRNSEDAAITDMEGKCKAFDDLGSKCDANQDWYAQYNDASIAVSSDTIQNSLKAVVDNAVLCKSGVDTATETANDCDNKQKLFKNAFCKYEGDLSRTCNTHGVCYTNEVANLGTTTSSVQALEKEQKTIWRMVGKVECYLHALLAAGPGTMPTQDTINGCVSEQPDDSALTIVYTEAEARDPCMEHPDLNGDLANDNYRPGKGNWYTTETQVKSGDLTKHDKLNADSHC